MKQPTVDLGDVVINPVGDPPGVPGTPIPARQLAAPLPFEVERRLQLEAAQTFLAGVWPLLNSLETSPQVTPAAQGLIRDAKKELEPLYLKAMGDELPPDQKPTPR